MEKFDISLLYVEDEDIMRGEVSQMLSRWVSELYVAKNGKDGLEKFNKYYPDVILTDINMPVMNGLEMLEEIRQTSNAKSIVMTAYTETEYFTQAIELGVDSFIVKPVLRKNLFDAIIKTATAVITQRKLNEKEKELIEREHKYRLLFEQSNDAILIINKDYKIIDINTKACKMLGYESNELLNMDVIKLHPKKEQDLAMQVINSVITKGSAQIEASYQKRDKKIIFVDISASNFDREKNIIQIIARNITQRKKNEAELNKYKNHLEEIVKKRTNELSQANQNLLQEIEERRKAQKALTISEKKYRDIFNNVNDSIIVFSIENNIIEVNENACKSLDYERHELLDLTIEKLLPEDRKEEILVRFNQVKIEDIPAFETEFISKNKQLIPVECNARVVSFKNKQAILTIIRDITERKNIQKKIISTIIKTEEKERLRFAKDLHDGIGSLLSSINIYINMLYANPSDIGEDKKYLTVIKELIDEAIQTAKEVANDIRPNVLSNFGLVESIKSFCEKLDALDKMTVNFDSSEFENKIDNNIELILYRVTNELINNTIKHANASNINIVLKTDQNDIYLYYSDNGKGFDLDEALYHKEDSMGLKNIISRINSIKGKCNIASKPGKGTKISIQIVS